ncbi:MFS transporter [Natronococcus pandeyae]|uniref:MFS transporter n=1 Tax=Natronococcus pandeyae TaxID=2055836 RepID=UPI00165322D6|nr:MFS transporter [Natronococcus pandeyae]
MAASGIFALVVTYLLFEPGRPLWGWIIDWIGTHSGEPVAMFFLVGLYALFGAVFSLLTGVRFDNFVAGGFLAYIALVTYLEAVAGPFDSPVHLFLGLFFLFGFGFGAKLAEGAEQRGVLRRRTPGAEDQTRE